MSWTAFPLLVLGLTGSAADAGVVGFLRWLPFLLFQLPAGVLVDRWDRKRVMIASDALRALAIASLVIAIAVDRITLAHIMVVAFLEGCGNVFFELGEHAAVRNVVPPTQLTSALAQNEARNRGAGIVGRPLGGILFGIGRAVPFLVDAVSYLVSLACVLLIRSDFQEERERERGRMLAEIREGFTWLWRQHFLRATLFLVAGSNFLFQALNLILIVIARDHGASPAMIGIMLAGLGVGGLLGALAAPMLQRRVPAKAVVIGANWVWAVLFVPVAFVTNAYLLGALAAATAFVGPAWNVVIGAYQLSLIPDRLLARVTSVDLLVAWGALPLGALAGGILIETLGASSAALALTAVMFLIALAATISPGVRKAPTLEEARLAATAASASRV
jgi:predicted MFS family arabinose efflux permease